MDFQPGSVLHEQQVFCTRFPSGEGRWQVSPDGGGRPHWSPEGIAAYYRNSDQELMRVEVTREPSLRFGIPQRVFPVKPHIAESAVISPVPGGRPRNRPRDNVAPLGRRRKQRVGAAP